MHIGRVGELGSAYGSPEPVVITNPTWEELAGDDISAAHQFRVAFFKLNSISPNCLQWAVFHKIPRSTQHRTNTNVMRNGVEGMQSENTTIQPSPAGTRGMNNKDSEETGKHTNQGLFTFKSPEVLH